MPVVRSRTGMGQGGACNKCSDVSINNKNAPRGLEETSSEEEEEDEEPSEEEDDGGEEANEARSAAELALQDGLKRGKTSTFKEAIEHATALGLDEEKISLAEKKLEEHKGFRRREAFEAELHDFLRTDANDIAGCEEKINQGKEYGVNEKLLKPLQDRIAELELMKDLRPDEVEQAKQFLELCTRRFVASCATAKGRDVELVDLVSGKKQKVVLKLDLTLKNLMVAGPSSGDLKCKVSDVSTSYAANAEKVKDTDGFAQLDQADRDNAVAVVLPSAGPWCFVESNKAKQDEFIVAFQVFNGLPAAGSGDTGGGETGGGETGGGKISPRAPSKKKTMDKKKEAAAEEEEATGESNLRQSAEGDADDVANPVSPRKAGKKATRDAKSPASKKKEDKLPDEKPPPPPPPVEEEGNNEEAEE